MLLGNYLPESAAARSTEAMDKPIPDYAVFLMEVPLQWDLPDMPKPGPQ